MINDMKVRADAIKTNFSCLDSQSKIELFNSQCLSLYGACLWNTDTTFIQKLEIAWRVSCRAILNVHPRTHNFLIPQLMGTPDIKSIVQCRTHRYGPDVASSLSGLLVKA